MHEKSASFRRVGEYMDLFLPQNRIARDPPSPALEDEDRANPNDLTGFVEGINDISPGKFRSQRTEAPVSLLCGLWSPTGVLLNAPTRAGAYCSCPLRRSRSRRHGKVMLRTA